MSLGMTSRVLPTASFAAILAMGNPVALDASAEERLTRGFISMIIISPGADVGARQTLLSCRAGRIAMTDIENELPSEHCRDVQHLRTCFPSVPDVDIHGNPGFAQRPRGFTDWPPSIPTLTLTINEHHHEGRTVDRVDAHLNVGAATLDAHLADDGDRRVAQPLVLLVRQRLRSYRATSQLLAYYATLGHAGLALR